MIISRIIFAAAIFTIIACTPSKNGAQNSEKHAYTNHLIHEKSPYLLQHAHNPVNWYPWGEEALAKAKKENKMLIISIGYSACHWCHVMEHESFEDTAVANLMNKYYVAIKVDREERPDIDDVYMSACQLVSRRGCGWPLNAFALPDGRPVWAGTYFPKDEWIKVLRHFAKEKEEHPDKLEEYATQLLQGIRQMDATPAGLKLDDNDYSVDILGAQTDKMVDGMDPIHGGRQGHPKFPMPINLEFLLKQQYHTGDQSTQKVLYATLDNMAKGGIYDQIGGGFARYSTDAKWLVPHFEKMLYDNGQLISLYANAYRATDNPLYKKIIEGTVAFAERELKSPEGGYYSSLDADSDGEEGKFYVWTQEELKNVLGDSTAFEVIKAYYGIKSSGNWEHGKNILHVAKSIDRLAKMFELSTSQIEAIIASANKKLFEARAKRIRPGTDTKILTAWNALLLKGYVDAYKATGDKKYLTDALALWQFLKEKMLQSDGSLHRNFKDGASGINGFLDDYVLTSDALVDLYEATFDAQYLREAQAFMDYALKHFNDPNDPLLYYTSDKDPSLITRKKETNDNVIPGSNSVAANVLYRLGVMLDKEAYIKRAKKMLNRVREDVETTDHPGYLANWLILYSDLVHRPYEVVVMGPEYRALKKELLSRYIPNAVFLGGDREGDLELLKDKLQDGQNFIYVCVNKVCKLPVQQVDKALRLIENE